jgi:2'-phosphotransferase
VEDGSEAAKASQNQADWLIRANQGHSIKLESEALLRPVLLPAEKTDKEKTGDQDLHKPDTAILNGNGNASTASASEPESDATTVAASELQPGPSSTSTPTDVSTITTSLPPAPVPPIVVHGTYFAFWPAIVTSGGLQPMSRTHVHFATGVPDGQEGKKPGVISGMRSDAELLIYVDVERSLREGAMTWWMSDNGVVLTEGVKPDGASGGKGLVPLKYFKEVVGRTNGQVGVLWRDGVKVADLPEGLKLTVPQGKGRQGRGGGARGGKGSGRGRGQQ